MESTNHYFRPLGLIILFCLFPVWVLAQTVSVTGVVKDASGEPIIGASVVEAGTTNGIVTDLDGNFKLNVSAKGSLKISFMFICPRCMKLTPTAGIRCCICSTRSSCSWIWSDET